MPREAFTWLLTSTCLCSAILPPLVVDCRHCLAAVTCRSVRNTGFGCFVFTYLSASASSKPRDVRVAKIVYDLH
jgi:hypothetical protein